jgi:uncharacterized protein (TIGR00251 family)
VNKRKDGITINLFITPNSKKRIFPSGINEWRKCIEIKVCSDAKENKANQEVIKTVADYFNKPINNVSIVSGEKSREKTLLIKDISIDFIINRLKESLYGL